MERTSRNIIYLDNTPTHSYMHFLYKYPQAAYPYADLVEINQRLSGISTTETERVS